MRLILFRGAILTSSKYKLMEENIARRKENLTDKIKEYDQTLQIIKLLQKKFAKEGASELITHFEVADTLFAKAKIPPGDTVSLWLGANVMVDYTHDEALALLLGKLSQAKDSLNVCVEEAEFLREQITTMEVNISKVYNLGVVQRQKTALKSKE